MDACLAPSALPGRHDSRQAPAGILTLLRHGQSEWNRKGRFTGWADIDLSKEGRAEAARAGRLIGRWSRPVDRCFTSMLRRASITGEIVLGEMGQHDLPVEQSWRLNERHYGALQGLRALPAAWRFGPLAVLHCRRRFSVRPPSLAAGDPRSPGLDPRYADLDPDMLPLGESVADTQARLLPYWRQQIAPELARGRHVLVVSHKNALRALLALLRSHAPEEIPAFRFANAAPLMMTFERSDRWILDAGSEATATGIEAIAAGDGEGSPA